VLERLKLVRALAQAGPQIGGDANRGRPQAA
jgi:hypothetical protein